MRVALGKDVQGITQNPDIPAGKFGAEEPCMAMSIHCTPAHIWQLIQADLEGVPVFLLIDVRTKDLHGYLGIATIRKVPAKICRGTWQTCRSTQEKQISCSADFTISFMHCGTCGHVFRRSLGAERIRHRQATWVDPIPLPPGGSFNPSHTPSESLHCWLVNNCLL